MVPPIPDEIAIIEGSEYRSGQVNIKTKHRHTHTLTATTYYPAEILEVGYPHPPPPAGLARGK